MSGFSTTNDFEDLEAAPIEITVRTADGSEVSVQGNISPGGRLVFEWGEEGLHAYAEPPLPVIAPRPANDTWPDPRGLH
jgi:hypothetical protein